MKFFKRMKDGGPESKSEGFWLIEAKKLLSIVLLHFSDGSREAYHSHAFHALSWVLRGKLTEHSINGEVREYKPSVTPVFTSRYKFHKVVSDGDTWALSFRGWWAKYWFEYLEAEHKMQVLTHGRKVVELYDKVS